MFNHDRLGIIVVIIIGILITIIAGARLITLKSAASNDTLEASKIRTEFYTLFPEAHPNIPVVFLDQHSFPKVKDPLTRVVRRAHGVCYIGQAQINKTFWKNANKWQRKKVVFHELGHCALDLNHPEDPFFFSIMNSVLWTVDKDGKNWDKLVEELQERARK